MAMKLFPVFVLMLLWLLYPVTAEWTSSTSTPCVRKVLQGGCNETTIDNSTACCSSIVSEAMSSKVCMCSALADDTSFVDGFLLYCGDTVNSILVFCPDATLLTSAPVTNTPPATTDNTSSTAPVPPSNSTTPPSSSNASGKKSNATVIAIVVVVIILVVVIIVISILCIHRRRNNKIKQIDYSDDVEKLQKESDSRNSHMSSSYVESQSTDGESLQPPPISSEDRGFDITKFIKNKEREIEKVDVKLDWSEYDKETLKKATDNFSNENKIGQGGFGSVYKGILDNKEKIAVKTLSKNSKQGEKEFKAEIERLAVLKHKNLIKLRGYCLEKDEEALVYEFADNNSLADHLFGGEDIREKLDWSIRLNIIKGFALGLHHMHKGTDPPTIHRDLKAGNILLDRKMNPKIADFGLARECDTDQTSGLTQRPLGTNGYIAPEYTLQYSTKTDVYAFGVVVLEIIRGTMVLTPIKDSKNLVHYAWSCFHDNNTKAIIDPLLKIPDSSEKELKEVQKCIILGLSCTQDVNYRLDMPTVLEHLIYNTAADLPTPRCPQHLFFAAPEPHPAYGTSGTTGSSGGTTSSN